MPVSDTVFGEQNTASSPPNVTVPDYVPVVVVREGHGPRLFEWPSGVDMQRSGARVCAQSGSGGLSAGVVFQGPASPMIQSCTFIIGDPGHGGAGGPPGSASEPCQACRARQALTSTACTTRV